MMLKERETFKYSSTAGTVEMVQNDAYWYKYMGTYTRQKGRINLAMLFVSCNPIQNFSTSKWTKISLASRL